MAGEAEVQLPAAPPAATVAETAAEREVFPPFDPTWYPSQLLWFVITFVALYFLLAKVAIPRIAGILEARRDRIAGDLDQAEEARNRSEEAIAAYEKALAEARRGANTIADGARNEAKKAADGQRALTEAELARRLAEAEGRIGAIKTRALSEVGAIASDTAEAVVRALADVDVTRKEVDDAVSAAMAK